MAKDIARRQRPKKAVKKKVAPKGKKRRLVKAKRTAATAAVLRYEPGRLIDGEEALAEAAAALRALDAPTMSRLIEIGGPPPLRRREPGFAGLAAIVVSQQVSVA